jgi:hypothetical protein
VAQKPQKSHFEIESTHDASQRNAALDRAARQRRRLARDADADGQRKRYREPNGRGSAPALPRPRLTSRKASAITSPCKGHGVGMLPVDDLNLPERLKLVLSFRWRVLSALLRACDRRVHRACVTNGSFCPLMTAPAPATQFFPAFADEPQIGRVYLDIARMSYPTVEFDMATGVNSNTSSGIELRMVDSIKSNLSLPHRKRGNEETPPHSGHQ